MAIYRILALFSKVPKQNISFWHNCTPKTYHLCTIQIYEEFLFLKKSVLFEILVFIIPVQLYTAPGTSVNMFFSYFHVLIRNYTECH